MISNQRLLNDRLNIWSCVFILNKSRQQRDDGMLCLVDTALVKLQCIKLINIYMDYRTFYYQEGHLQWWGKSLSLVGNFEGLVGKIHTSLSVKKCPVKFDPAW